MKQFLNNAQQISVQERRTINQLQPMLFFPAIVTLQSLTLRYVAGSFLLKCLQNKKNLISALVNLRFAN